MRLTPFWFRSSNPPSDERSENDNVSPTVTIHYAQPASNIPEEPPDHVPTASEFVPESDTALVSHLEEIALPATVDEVADHLIQPANPPVETWADVHERLHRDRLPALDGAGEVEFDVQNGLVDLPTDSSSADGLATRPIVGAASIALLFLLLVVLTSVVAALTVTLVIVTIIFQL